MPRTRADLAHRRRQGDAAAPRDARGPGAARVEGTSAPGAAAGLGGAVLAGAVALALTSHLATSWPGVGTVEVAVALEWVLLLAAAGLAWWGTAVLGAAALAVLPGRGRAAAWLRGLARAVSPRAARWVASALLVGSGTVLVGAPVAGAAPPAAVGATVELRPTDPVPEPGWEDTGWTPATTPATRRAAPVDVGLVSGTLLGSQAGPTEGGPHHRVTGTATTVVVHRGDTLWSIAARSLGPGATLEEIAAEWPRWHAANRDVVGADPDLILPGQQLTAPRGGR